MAYLLDGIEMYEFLCGSYRALQNTVSRRFIFSLMCMISMAIVLCSCSKSIVTHGDFLEEDDLRDLVVGTSKIDDVISVLGEPAVRLNDGLWWLYIGSRHDLSRNIRPAIVERSVYTLVFDKTGVLREIEHNA